MDITQEDQKPLQKKIKVTIEKDDYDSKVKSELKKLSKNAEIKGFRKGKVPMSYLKKAHGQEVLSKKVYEILEENLNDYIDAHEMRILGQPLVSKDQESFQFDVNNLRDYTFIFDVGLAPEMELEGFDESSSYDRYDVQITDEQIDEEIEGMRKQAGNQIEVEGDINDNDILVLEGKEMEDGEVKDEGWDTSFSVHVGNMKEDVQEKMIGKDKGLVFTHNIYELAENSSEEFVKKHYLNMDEDEDIEVNDEFEFEVVEIKRLQPADLDEDFYEQAFGGEVETEEEAREYLRREIKKQFDKQADAILSHTMRDELIEKNEVEMPYEFLERWLKQKQQEDGQELSEEEFQQFLKNMRWSLITSEIRDQYDLEVSQEEIMERLKQQVSQQMQGYQLPPEFMQQFIQETAKDEEKVREIADRIMGDKIVATFKENVDINDIPIEIDEFNELSQEFAQKLQAEQSAEEE